MELNAHKLEIQKQWDKDPCGASTATDKIPETLEFYQAVREHRYKVYAPWFDSVVHFEEWRDKDILEIGVGLGSDHFRFAQGGNRMTALDLSQEHLRQTTRHLKLEGLSTTPIYGDAEQMPFEDESFDLVYAFGVLHHTPNTEAAIREIYRVLRPEGTAIIGLYHRYSYFMLWVLIWKGLILGGLWRKGWRQLLSEIEYRRDLDSAMPLVKVYSRRQAKTLFSQFSRVEVTRCHVSLGRFQDLSPVPRSVIERILGWCGWYLMIKADKKFS
ncbi:class I SAM-dependent methyltransferase [Microcoleus sp. FACHB-53]|nr:class I SAM-dependent methyltransferase [Microcoleus sp. FACHB-53]